TDKLFILSDFDAHGKAKKVQTFAADLNSPIGILPLPDCKSCIVSSVGEILKLTDTNDDGKYDKKEVLFTGFGSRDTHGMYNSFTLMPDGWVYACHGFNNDSTVKGKDGHEVKMHSGNTFRFRPDGSRIEVYTRGQVNPFGMCVDPWFNLYTADCHSKPITQLIPGAVYESFGKPHDGLGYGPVMFGYDPGGTGLCGVSWYDADHFPKKYQGCMFLGNVVTSRVNFCKIEWTGATPRAVQQPDFIKSDDPWFRPVDIKLGPDGAIYLTDFYNKIIGHYEVDLRHPQRDKDHGRLWRVIYKGEPGIRQGEPATLVAGFPKPAYTDLTKNTPAELVKLLEHPNISVRMAATNQFLVRKGEWWDAFPQMKGGNDAGVKNQAQVYAAFPMLAENAGILKRETDYHGFFPLITLAPDHDPAALELAVGIAKGLRTRREFGDGERKLLIKMMSAQVEGRPENVYGKSFAKRADVEAIIFHPHAEFIKPLVELIQKIPAGDLTLRHAARIALRNCLKEENAWAVVHKLPADQASIIVDVALAVPNPSAAEYLANKVASGTVPADRLSAVAEHVGRYGYLRHWEKIVESTEKNKNGEIAIAIIQSMIRGIPSNSFRNTASQALASILLTRACAELNQGNRETQFASLRLISELPTVLPTNFSYPENANPKPRLNSLILDPKNADDLRVAALDTFTRIDMKLGLAASEKLIDTPSTTPLLRERAALILAGSADRNHKQAAKDAIKSVPYRSCVVIATALAGNTTGGEILLEAVKQGKAPPRVLQEKQVLDRLRAARIENLDKQIADLTKGLQPADQKLADLIKQRTVKFTAAKFDKEAGAKLFTKHCGACHKIGEAGGKVGPNLDGIGVRGLERLLEDTLDPNRNVDAAFRARVLNLTDGTSKTGLMLRVEGEVLVMVDDQGKEFRVPTKEIEKNRETMLSPMPANFGEVIPEAEFFQIMAYLLDQKGK
ncbi:MAG TPA: c-type cytochrome, partial [Urbifossiella sp.]